MDRRHNNTNGMGGGSSGSSMGSLSGSSFGGSQNRHASYQRGTNHSSSSSQHGENPKQSYANNYTSQRGKRDKDRGYALNGDRYEARYDQNGQRYEHCWDKNGREYDVVYDQNGMMKNQIFYSDGKDEYRGFKQNSQPKTRPDDQIVGQQLGMKAGFSSSIGNQQTGDTSHFSGSSQPAANTGSTETPVRGSFKPSPGGTQPLVNKPTQTFQPLVANKPSQTFQPNTDKSLGQVSYTPKVANYNAPPPSYNPNGPRRPGSLVQQLRERARQRAEEDIRGREERGY